MILKMKKAQNYILYKSVMCRYDRMIESYHIDNQSPVYVFIPKQIYDVSIAVSIGLFILHTSIKNLNYKNE